jgi:hypothetical protein
MSYPLINLFEHKVWKVRFENDDGRMREMLCTRSKYWIKESFPEYVPPKSLPYSVYENIPVWDMENKGWRSFNVLKLKSMEDVTLQSITFLVNSKVNWGVKM